MKLARLALVATLALAPICTAQAQTADPTSPLFGLTGPTGRTYGYHSCTTYDGDSTAANISTDPYGHCWAQAVYLIGGISGGSGVATAITDASGTVTVGGTSQQAAAASVTRKYVMCQNPSATASGVAAESLFVNFTSSASSAGGSYELANGQTLSFDSSFIPTGAINVTAPTTGHKFTCKVG